MCPQYYMHSNVINMFSLTNNMIGWCTINYHFSTEVLPWYMMVESSVSFDIFLYFLPFNLVVFFFRYLFLVQKHIFKIFLKLFKWQENTEDMFPRIYCPVLAAKWRDKLRWESQVGRSSVRSTPAHVNWRWCSVVLGTHIRLTFSGYIFSLFNSLGVNV